MKRTFLLAATLLSVLLNGICLESAFANPLGPPSRPLYSKMIAGSEVVVLASCEKTHSKKGNRFGTAKFKIERIGRDKTKSFTIDQIVVCDSLKLNNLKPGEKYLLTGRTSENHRIEWVHTERPTTAACFAYVMETPATDLPQARRLPYFLLHIDSEDRLIREDANDELRKAEFTDLVAIADRLPREKILRWFDQKEYEKEPFDCEVYGQMLGLCGNKEDAAVLEQIAFAERTDFFVGLSNIIAGYLMLSGEPGLDKIDKLKLSDPEMPFSETYGTMQALRIMWEEMPGRISKDRLKQSMWLLLGRPKLADLVINDLTHWEDWEAIEQVIEMYDKETFDNNSTKRAVIQYLLTCAELEETSERLKPSQHVQLAKEALEQIRKQDPKFYQPAILILRPGKKEPQP